MPRLTLSLLPEIYAVCRGPAAVMREPAGPFTLLVHTPDEVTLVCPADRAPADVEIVSGWRCLRIDQTFAFDMPGILASVLQPLAEAGVGIFATSTFTTDYVLVKADNLERALEALQISGHRVL